MGFMGTMMNKIKSNKQNKRQVTALRAVTDITTNAISNATQCNIVKDIAFNAT